MNWPIHNIYKPILSFSTVVYAYAKRGDSSDDSVTKDGELHLQVIELIKDEYKVGDLLNKINWMC